MEVVPVTPRGHPGPGPDGLACPGALPGGWQFARPGRWPGKPLGTAPDGSARLANQGFVRPYI